MPERMSDGQKLAIAAAFERGEDSFQVSEEQLVSYSHANRLRRQYEAGGVDLLLARPTGTPGSKRMLTDEMVEVGLKTPISSYLH